MNRKKKLSALPEGAIAIGFDAQILVLRMDQIMPLKPTPENVLAGSKYQQILSSIREVGVIEPPVVAPDGQNKSRYILLDGHLRLHALKALGAKEVACLRSSDDESFTYNKHVNRLSPVQEHRMILRAVERGVAEEKIAKALNLDVKSIIAKRNLLDGICSDAADMLKDKMVAVGVFSILKRMKPYRQIEAVTLMTDAGVYSLSYARALLAATPKDQLTQPDKPKRIKGLTDEQLARMEHEMTSLQREYQLLKDSYGPDVLNLTLAKGYLSSLLANARVVRHLAQHHAELLREFQKITEMTSLAGSDAA